jgi:hypothetical protein
MVRAGFDIRVPDVHSVAVTQMNGSPDGNPSVLRDANAALLHGLDARLRDLRSELAVLTATLDQLRPSQHEHFAVGDAPLTKALLLYKDPFSAPPKLACGNRSAPGPSAAEMQHRAAQRVFTHPEGRRWRTEEQNALVQALEKHDSVVHGVDSLAVDWAAVAAVANETAARHPLYKRTDASVLTGKHPFAYEARCRYLGSGTPEIGRAVDTAAAAQQASDVEAVWLQAAKQLGYQPFDLARVAVDNWAKHGAVQWTAHEQQLLESCAPHARSNAELTTLLNMARAETMEGMLCFAPRGTMDVDLRCRSTGVVFAGADDEDAGESRASSLTPEQTADGALSRDDSATYAGDYLGERGITDIVLLLANEVAGGSLELTAKLLGVTLSKNKIHAAIAAARRRSGRFFT